jgi:hypothetical protein
MKRKVYQPGFRAEGVRAERTAICAVLLRRFPPVTKRLPIVPLILVASM